MVPQKKCTIELPFKFSFIRASTLVVLNSYIAIFSTTKYQNVPYNGGAKAIFFGSIATVHIYFWLCTIAKKKKKIICAFTLLLIILLIFILSSILISLLLRSYCYCLCGHTSFTSSFFIIQHSHCYIYCLCVHTSIVLLFLYFFFSYILFFLFLRLHCYGSRYIILL